MMSTKDRRQKYLAMERKGFTDEEVIQVMQLDELKMNARKGGEIAIKELKRREALDNLRPMPIENDLDLGV